VKSVGEEWKATSLVYTTTTVKKTTTTKEEEEENLKKRSKEEEDDDELLVGRRRLLGEQPLKTVESSTTDDTTATAAAGGGTPHPLIALGLPADVEEAKAHLKRINAETIPHGNHRDFLYKNHLLHFYERRRRRDDDRKAKTTKRMACAGVTAESNTAGAANVLATSRITGESRR